MEISRRGFVGAAAVAASLASAANAKVRPEPMVNVPLPPDGRLARYMDDHRAAWGIPGMTAVVVSADGDEWFARSGLADVERNIPVGPDHLFQIGSISKMFTALAAWSLIEEGKLSPDIRLSDALKGISVAGGKAITLRHLLNHTSGLPADSEIFPAGGLKTGFAPGADWSYSNCGYALAGMIAEAADGRLYPEMVKARVLDKIGMTASVPAMRIADRQRFAQGYEPSLSDRLNPRPGPMRPAPWVDSDSPAGCIAATAGDMAKFLRFMIGLSDGKGGPVFSDETAVRFLADPVDGWGPDSKYGNGVARLKADGRDYLHHTGGMVSFCSALHVDREARIGAFASSNVHYSLDYRPVRVSTFGCELMRATKAAAPLPEPKSPTIALEKPEQYAGVFTSNSGERFTVAVNNGGLVLERNGVISPLQQAQGSLFATTDPDFAVEGVVIDVEAGKPVRAWVGETEYRIDPALGFQPPAAERLRAIAGRYDNDDPWAGIFTVVARAGKLYVGNVIELVALPGGDYRLGEEDSPERIRFDAYINGRPHRLSFSGTPYIRRFS